MSFHASYVSTLLASLKSSWLKGIAEMAVNTAAYLDERAAPGRISRSPRRTWAQREVRSPAWDRVSVCTYLAYLSFSNKRKGAHRPNWHTPDQPTEPEMLPCLPVLVSKPILLCTICWSAPMSCRMAKFSMPPLDESEIVIMTRKMYELSLL